MGLNGFVPVIIFFEWVCSDDDFLIGGLGFNSAAWVSDRWLGFADWWLGWWVWWPLLAPTGLMVFVCVFCVRLFVSSGFLIWVSGVFHWFLINFDIWLSGLLSFPEFYRVYFVVYCVFPLIFSSGCGFFDCLMVDFVCFFFWIDFDIWLCGLLSFPVLYRLYFVVYYFFTLIFSSRLCGFYCFFIT